MELASTEADARARGREFSIMNERCLFHFVRWEKSRRIRKIDESTIEENCDGRRLSTPVAQQCFLSEPFASDDLYCLY